MPAPIPAPPSPGPALRVLLIGVDHYLRNRTSAGTFLSLSGCVRDVESVEAMLCRRVASPSITKLTSPTVDGERAEPQPGVLLPTYRNIRAALEKLVKDTREGDSVFIYYSGHGARIRTAFEDLKGPGGFDEALVPMDIQDKDTRYIRDLDLAFILHCLVQKSARLTLVFDCCHSGGTTRAAQAPGTAVRCATERPSPGAIDTTERPLGGFESDAVLRAAYQALRDTGRVTRDARTGKTWLPPSRGYVLLAACLETQAALEASTDGSPHMGVLTRAWLDTLCSAGPDATWKMVFERTARRMEDAGFRNQTPVLLGDEHREVFGVKLLETPHTLTVSEVDVEGARVRVDGGLAMGITPGSEIGIYASGTAEFASDAGLLAVGRVTSAAAGAAWADCDRALIGGITLLAPAVLRGLSVRSTFALAPRRAPPPGMTSAAEQRALRDVRESLGQRGAGFVAEAAPGETPTFLVGLDDEERYVLMSAEGVPLARVPAIPIRADNAALRVIDRLSHLARCAAMTRITSSPSILDSQVEVTLVTEGTGMPVVRGERGRYSVSAGNYAIRVANSSSLDLFMGILDLQSDFAVKLLWPPEDGSEAYVVVPARSVKEGNWRVEFYVPDGFASAEDRLRVFLLTSRADYRRLTMPSLGRQSMQPGLSEPQSALDRLFDAVSRSSREVRRSTLTDTPWRVQDFLVEVHRAPG